MPIGLAPSWIPFEGPVGVGAVGTVLTSQGKGNQLKFAAPGAPSFVALGAYLLAAVPAGSSNDFNPGGAWPTIGRLDVTLALGAATLTGLVAGTDGQLVLLFNADPANNLTLDNQNAASAAANRFEASGNWSIVPGGALWLAYYAGTVNRWRITP